MAAVTDPDLLAKLNSSATPSIEAQPVSDPAVLAKLNGGEPKEAPNYDLAWGGMADPATMTGVARGVLEAPGIAGDLANLAQVGIGKATGNQEMADYGRKGLAGENGFDAGSGWIDGLLDRHGILTYKPQNKDEERGYNVGNFMGNSVGMGVPGLIKSGIKSGGEAVAKQFGKDALVGTGSGVGNEVGREFGDSVPDASPWQKLLYQIGGAITGGGATGAAMNRSVLRDTPQIVKDYEAAGVKPRLPSDVNPDPGLIGRFASETLPDVYGAQGTVRRAAGTTQDEISSYAKRLLDPTSAPSEQEMGKVIKTEAESAVKRLNDEVDNAYTSLRSVIPPASTMVETKNTQTALNAAVSQAQNPQVAEMLKNPVFEKYAKLFEGGKNPELSWNDLDLLRREIGQSMQGAAGAELGLYKQLYRGINDDMRGAAANVRGGTEAFDAARAAADNKRQQIDTILGAVGNKELPEQLPSWLINNSGKQGATRFENLFGNSPQMGQDLGRWLLGNRAQNVTNQFDVDQLMKFWKGLAPEAQQALTQDPTVRDGVARLERMYDATGQSRMLATRDAPAPGMNPLLQEAMAGSVIGGTSAGAMDTAGLAHGAGIGAMLLPPAMTAGAYGAAQAATSPGLVSRFATPVAGDMMPRSEYMGRPAIVAGKEGIPDVTTPPEPQQVMTWLGTANRQQVVPFVTQRLGADVGKQLAEAGDNYNAALFGIMSDPNYRRLLVGNRN